MTREQIEALRAEPACQTCIDNFNLDDSGSTKAAGNILSCNVCLSLVQAALHDSQVEG